MILSTTTSLILIIIIAVLALACLFFFLRYQKVLLQHQVDLQALDSESVVIATERKHLSEANTKLQAQLEALQQSYSEQGTRYAELEARTKAEQKSLDEKIELLQKSREQLAGEFENLANRIFDEKAQKFERTSKQTLEGTLSPLKQQLTDFRSKVEEVYSNESKERHLLKDQITQLREDSLKIGEDANKLTRALKHDNKAQGNWGELTLIRALEMCGLREPEEYETQVSMKAEDGSKQIPDVVVHLPGGKDVIIDSKVSLLAYTRYFDAENDEQRQLALEEHVSSIRTHIKGLSQKNYDSLVGVNTLDYVMLYIPIEGASALALQNDKDIWGDAYNKNIVLVSPTNLLAILRSVETIWRHERQNKNAEKIALEAGNLHDKFVSFIESLEEVGRHLDKAQSAYDTSFKRLSTGSGNLIRRVAVLKDLGAKAKKELPDTLSIEDDS
ncbi:DNA recombination protein RmuC [Pseudomonadales bacterium]|nr:DNA recombination protein RmuC [Pseudomonadales bacterium]